MTEEDMRLMERLEDEYFWSLLRDVCLLMREVWGVLLGNFWRSKELTQMTHSTMLRLKSNDGGVFLFLTSAKLVVRTQGSGMRTHQPASLTPKSLPFQQMVFAGPHNGM